jgi:NitT/TauT family transport system substrate-binding protein
VRQEPEKAAALLAQENRAMSPNFIMKTCAISPKYCASLPDEYIQSTLDFIPVLENMGYLKRSLNRQDIFDCSLITAVHPEPHHYE